MRIDKFMDLDFVSVHKQAKKELCQYPAILTSHVVNNPYLHLNGKQFSPWLPFIVFNEIYLI